MSRKENICERFVVSFAQHLYYLSASRYRTLLATPILFSSRRNDGEAARENCDRESAS
jgi:hypothetical protein